MPKSFGRFAPQTPWISTAERDEMVKSAKPFYIVFVAYADETDKMSAHWNVQISFSSQPLPPDSTPDDVDDYLATARYLTLSSNDWRDPQMVMLQLEASPLDPIGPVKLTRVGKRAAIALEEWTTPQNTQLPL